MSIASDSVSQLSAEGVDRGHRWSGNGSVALHFFRMGDGVVRLVRRFVVLSLELVMMRLHFLPAHAIVIQSTSRTIFSTLEVVLCQKSETCVVDHSLKKKDKILMRRSLLTVRFGLETGS